MLLHLNNEHRITTTDVRSAQRRTRGILTDNFEPCNGTEVKSFIARSLCLWFVEDMIPYNAVNGKGFQSFMLRHKLINSIEELPSNVTLSGSALNDLYTIAKADLKRMLTKAPKVITITIDMWTSPCGAVPYITICLRYFDDDFVLKNFTLTTEHLPRPHTAIAIAKCIEENLEEHGLLGRLIILVGDNGANILAVMTHLKNAKYFQRCYAHQFHLVLTSDAPKRSCFKKFSDVLKKLKRTHGALAYQLSTLKDINKHIQTQNFFKYIQELEEMYKQLQLDEEINVGIPSLGELGDDALIEMEENKGFQRMTGFHKENATRWFSQQKMVESYLTNVGKLFYKLVFSLN